MTIKYALHSCLQFGLAGLLGCLSANIFTAKTHAQQSNIVPDNTLGAESSQVIGNYQGQPIEVIIGGATRQINLFHSFQEFNISEGRGAYFFSPSADIQNILARVTGNNPSEILGKLGAFQIINGNIAGYNGNLFLINPNGIVFGNNASLDVQGSFLGTTANGVQFGNQGVFSATNPQAVPLLTVNPSALLFNQINQGGIINRSRQLAIPGSFYLIGGDIRFDGGGAYSLGNRLELGAVAGIGTVDLIGSGNQMQLAFPESVPKGDIVLQNNAFASTTRGSAITVNARDINLSDRSFINSILQTGEGTPGVAVGDVVVNATGNVTLSNLSNIASFGLENSLGNTGNVAINAQSIRLTNQSDIASSGPRSRGNIILNPKDNVSLDDNSFISTIGIFNPIGKSGDITITTQNINLSNQSIINSGNTGQGQSGKITLKAQEAISLTSGSSILSASVASAFSQVDNQPSGDIEIKTRNLKLDGDYTSINSSNLDEGRGGDIRVAADDSILLNRFALISSSSAGDGDGGNIELQTRSLTISNGGNISTQSSGRGNSGNLLVNASDSVTLSGIATLINPQTGKAVTTASRLVTSAFGTGNAGNITVKAQTINLNNNSLIDSNIGSTERQPAKGNVGNIELSARTVSLTDGAQLQAGFYSGGQGNAGLVSVKAQDTISFTGTNSGIFANVESGAVGNGSNIQISAPSVSFTNGAVVNNSNAGQGNGGNITITAGSFFLNNSFVITSNSGQGNAGNILVQAQDNIWANGYSLIGSNIGSPEKQPAKGNVGNIELSARTVSLTDGAQLQAGFYSGGQGNAGLVSVKAQNTISFTGTNSGIFANVESGAVGDGSDIEISAPSVSFTNGALVDSNSAGQGNGGNIHINTQDLLTRDGSRISTITFGVGKAGNLTVNASKKVELIGTLINGFPGGLIASAERGSIGDAGNLTVNTQNLIVRDGAQVLTSTFSSGRGGNLTVNASESVQLIGQSANSDFLSGLFASSEKDATGNAGNLTVNTQRLLARDGGQIIASTFNSGQAGNLTVNASENVQLIGQSVNNEFPSGLFVSATRNSTGDAGNLKVNTRQLLVRDGAGVFVNSQGTGNAGIMTINADTIFLDNQAFLNANTRSPNKDPNREQATININTQNLTLRHGSSITTNATGENVFGGNINTYTTKFLIALEDSRISANSDNSRGGRVVVNAQGVFVGTQPSDVSKYITATSGVGLSGSVEVNSPDNSSIQNSFTELSPVIDTNALIANSCISRATKRQENSFTITGSGGLTTNRPGILVSTYYTTGDVQGVETTSHAWKKGDAIIEPQGLYRLDNKHMVLSRECSH